MPVATTGLPLLSYPPSRGSKGGTPPLRGQGGALALLPQTPEERADLGGEGVGLFHGGEVAAPGHGGPALGVGVGLFGDGAGWTDYFLGEGAVAHGDVDGAAGRDGPAEVHPGVVWPEGGAAG